MILDEMTEARQRNAVEVKAERDRKLTEILRLSRSAEQEETFSGNVEVRSPVVPALPKEGPSGALFSINQ